MLSIRGHCGNTNQSYSEISLDTYQDNYFFLMKITSIGKDVENVNDVITMEKSDNSSKAKHKIIILPQVYIQVTENSNSDTNM